MMSATAFSSLALEASRRRSDQMVMFLAVASNSPQRSQISGFALLWGPREPSGKSEGICIEVTASTSAFAAMPLMSPDLNLACISFHCAAWIFIRRCRSYTTSPVPTILGAEPVVQALIVAAISTSTGMLRRPVVRRVMSPPRDGGMPPLLDLVLHRGNAFQEARDRLEIRLRHVLVAGRCPLDHLAHEAARHVAVRPVPRLQIRDDLFLVPVQARS